MSLAPEVERADEVAAVSKPFDKKLTFSFGNVHGSFDRSKFSDVSFPDLEIPALGVIQRSVDSFYQEHLVDNFLSSFRLEPLSPLVTCPPCQGTGGVMEGPHLGALCRVCKGSGSIPRERLPLFDQAAREQMDRLLRNP